MGKQLFAIPQSENYISLPPLLLIYTVIRDLLANAYSGAKFFG